MANVTLFMFVYAHTYILGLMNEKCIMCTYVAYIWKQNWQRIQTQRDKDRERQANNIKHRGLHHTFFLLNGAVWKKQDYSLQCSVWVETKNIYFNFDIVLKSVLGMQ